MVVNDKNRFVFIDYAHTPDALYKLASLKPFARAVLEFYSEQGEIEIKAKRPLMAKAKVC